MEIEKIEIGSKWEDSLGMLNFKGGQLQKGVLKRFVTITDKTKNSIEYRDGGGFLSWITFEDFERIEKSVQKVRFVQI
jgi:hypothetical protein